MASPHHIRNGFTQSCSLSLKVQRQCQPSGALEVRENEKPALRRSVDLRHRFLDHAIHSDCACGSSGVKEWPDPARQISRRLSPELPVSRRWQGTNILNKGCTEQWFGRGS